MKNQFRGYYAPDEQDLAALWTVGLIVLDTNVLLSLYEYSDRTRGELLQLISAVRDRVWIPHQVASEFQRNRLNRISQALAVRQKIREDTLSLTEAISKYLDPVDPQVSAALTHVMGFVEGRIADHKTVLGDEQGRSDSIRGELDNILDSRIGPAPDEEGLERLTKEAGRRSAARIPPGYEDAGKSEGREIGDYVLWQQTLDHSRAEGRPLIFVTEERKEDWWSIHRGSIVGPRPELVEEFWSEVHKPFWMYRTESFLLAARERLDGAISAESLSEVKIVSERLIQDEDRRRRHRDDSQVNRRKRELGFLIREINQHRDLLEQLESELSLAVLREMETRNQLASIPSTRLMSIMT